MPKTCILVMGLTGSGKTRLIREVIKSDKESKPEAAKGVPDLGTTQIQEFTFKIDGHEVTLVDTPGFDNTAISDRDILDQIVAWMSLSKSPVHGIIYIHPLCRVASAAIAANLKFLQKFCGDQNLSAVSLISTFWDGDRGLSGTIPSCKNRHEKLLSTSWEVFLDSGNRTWESRDGPVVTKAIINQYIDRSQPVVFNIYKEAVVDKLPVEQTTAGIELQGHSGRNENLLEAKISALESSVREKEEALAKSQESHEKEVAKVSALKNSVREKEEALIKSQESHEKEVAKLTKDVDEKQQALTQLHEYFEREQSVWMKKTTELENRIQQHEEEIARLKGQQSVRKTPKVVQVGFDWGPSFCAYGTANATVQSIEVYHIHVLWTPFIKGIRLTWSDGKKSELFGSSILCYCARYDFSADDRIQSMSITATDHVCSIEFTTNKGRLEAGGSCGSRSDVDVGNGILLGMEGKKDIDFIRKIGFGFG